MVTCRIDLQMHRKKRSHHHLVLNLVRGFCLEGDPVRVHKRRSVAFTPSVAHLPEAVQLQAADADGVHDGRVVDDPHRDARLPRPQLKVRVRRRPAHCAQVSVLLAAGAAQLYVQHGAGAACIDAQCSYDLGKNLSEHPFIHASLRLLCCARGTQVCLLADVAVTTEPYTRRTKCTDGPAETHVTPERVADDEEGDIHIVGAVQDILCRALNHLPVRHDHLLAIEGLLHGTQARVTAISHEPRSCASGMSPCIEKQLLCRAQCSSGIQCLAQMATTQPCAHQSFLGHEQDRRVRF